MSLYDGMAGPATQCTFWPGCNQIPTTYLRKFVHCQRGALNSYVQCMRRCSTLYNVLMKNETRLINGAKDLSVCTLGLIYFRAANSRGYTSFHIRGLERGMARLHEC